jgi:dienelactone hydrolase
MYGKGKVTEHPSQAVEWSGAIEANREAWLARAEAGLAVLRQNPRVDPSKLVAIGYCFGGATVLQLAYSGSNLAGVVSFHGSLPIPSREQAASTKARILLCHGAQDAFVAESHIQELRARLEEGDCDYQLIYYSGAKHGFTNPAADTFGLDNLKYNLQADQRSWRHMRDFFEEIFSPN